MREICSKLRISGGGSIGKDLWRVPTPLPTPFFREVFPYIPVLYLTNFIYRFEFSNIYQTSVPASLFSIVLLYPLLISNKYIPARFMKNFSKFSKVSTKQVVSFSNFGLVETVYLNNDLNDF